MDAIYFEESGEICERIYAELLKRAYLSGKAANVHIETPSSLTHTMRVDSEGQVTYTPKDASFYG